MALIMGYVKVVVSTWLELTISNRCDGVYPMRIIVMDRWWQLLIIGRYMDGIS